MPLTVLSSDTLEQNRKANTNLILELKKFPGTAANPDDNNGLEILHTNNIKTQGNNDLLLGGNATKDGKTTTLIHNNNDNNNNNNTEHVNNILDNQVIDDNIKDDEVEVSDLEKTNTHNENESKSESKSENKHSGDGDGDDGSVGKNINYDIDDIDYLISDDKELINIIKINNIVDKYINNYYSENIQKYKKTFKNLYQKYSNKRYTINNSGSLITVIKNTTPDKTDKTDKHDKHDKHDKNPKKIIKKITPDILYELKKPVYLFYNDNENLSLLKSNISNYRAELQFVYQKLINKLNVDIEEKKQFEEQRIQFVNLLEQYYTYTLYHKKINKISILNKTTIILQNITSAYLKNKLLEGGIYYIDNSLIDLINKYNVNKLNEYNNVIYSIQGINNNTPLDKKKLDIITQYVNKTELHKLNDLINETKKKQLSYINYIITELP